MLIRVYRCFIVGNCMNISKTVDFEIKIEAGHRIVREKRQKNCHFSECGNTKNTQNGSFFNIWQKKKKKRYRAKTENRLGGKRCRICVVDCTTDRKKCRFLRHDTCRRRWLPQDRSIEVYNALIYTQLSVIRFPIRQGLRDVKTMADELISKLKISGAGTPRPKIPHDMILT